jgi:hypothetical protein
MKPILIANISSAHLRNVEDAKYLIEDVKRAFDNSSIQDDYHIIYNAVSNIEASYFEVLGLRPIFVVDEKTKIELEQKHDEQNQVLNQLIEKIKE